MTYGTGMTFVGSSAASSNTASSKLDGPLMVQIKSTGGVSMQISTPVALTGAMLESGAGDENAISFVPKSGTFNVKTSDLTTSTTLNGSVAKVSADTDRNGSMDLVFDSNWIELNTW